MRFACLTGAKLGGANLFEPDLQEADLWQANLREAALEQVDPACGGVRPSRSEGGCVAQCGLKGCESVRG